MPTILLRAVAVAALCAVPPCQEARADAPAGAVQDTDNRYRFPVWHADFPVLLELPSANPAQVYQRSRRQALERVASNLAGNTRREVWLMATDFFAHAPDDAAEVLVAAMDQALGQASISMQDVLLNTIEAMTRMARPEFEEPLRRALEHPNESVRQAAYGGLSVCAGGETLQALLPAFLQSMNGRSRAAWVRGVRERLGHDAVPVFRKIMVNSTPIAIRDMILKETLKLDAADAADVLEPMFEEAAGDFRFVIAGVLHGAGRASGTVFLRNALIDANPKWVILGLKSLRARELGPLRDDVLRCSTHDSPDVRLELAKTLAGRTGDDVVSVFEVLAGSQELIETKCLAMHELTRHGNRNFVAILLDEAKTASGTQLETILRLLAASGDEQVVPILRERFEAAPNEEGRSFLQALSTCQAKGAADVLVSIFLGEDRPVSKPGDGGPRLTTKTYLPTLMLNVHGEEMVFLDAWSKVPPTDYLRRSLLLNTLCGFAADREDPALRAAVYQRVREILFDTNELPQLRIQALNALARRAIDMDDVMRLRRLQESAARGESPSMRALLKDYLFEYF